MLKGSKMAYFEKSRKPNDGVGADFQLQQIKWSERKDVQ